VLLFVLLLLTVPSSAAIGISIPQLLEEELGVDLTAWDAANVNNLLDGGNA